MKSWTPASIVIVLMAVTVMVTVIMTMYIIGNADQPLDIEKFKIISGHFDKILTILATGGGTGLGIAAMTKKGE